jgi:hypothetical protein
MTLARHIAIVYPDGTVYGCAWPGKNALAELLREAAENCPEASAKIMDPADCPLCQEGERETQASSGGAP